MADFFKKAAANVHKEGPVSAWGDLEFLEGHLEDSVALMLSVHSEAANRLLPEGRYRKYDFKVSRLREESIRGIEATTEPKVEVFK